MRVYEFVGGSVFTIGDLWEEYENLQMMQIQNLEPTFEDYVQGCIDRGLCNETEANTFEYKTLFAEVGRKVQSFLNCFGYKYTLSFESNLIWKFDILATKRQKEDLLYYIKGVAA